jgi:hypothetical protein
MNYSTGLELEMLKWFASNAKHGIVEIGVLNGDTTKELLAASSVPVYGIDPFIPDSMSPSLRGSKEKVMNNVGANPRFNLFCDYSWNVVKGFNHIFDMIYIDGDHTYEGVRMDFEKASEFQFRCPECGQIMNEQDNSRTIEFLTDRLKELEVES